VLGKHPPAAFGLPPNRSARSESGPRFRLPPTRTSPPASAPIPAVTCAACGRPVAAARPTCLYCGAPLALASQPAGATPEGATTAPVERVLLVLDLAGIDAAALTGALGLPAFEAGQWVRRGGFRLHRIAERADASREAARLADAGIRVRRLAEAEVRAAAQPLVALAGAWRVDALEVRTPEGRAGLGPGQVLIVVKGPIVRERQAAAGESRRLRSAAPEGGLRIHLHRRSEVRPLELDPEAFAFGPGAGGSALLQLCAWAEELGRGRPADDAFRYLAPALAPSQPVPGGAAAAASALAAQARRRGSKPLLLDNVQQFRFYSAWRASLERQS